jgi:ascorbate-specific PTS system EIIC-type component UlaA
VLSSTASGKLQSQHNTIQNNNNNDNTNTNIKQTNKIESVKVNITVTTTIIIIQFNCLFLCAKLTATRQITETGHCRYW